MKKRLLTAWIIACMFICLVGQTPLVALADGDDTRVISVPEGLQEVLVNETPEVQTVETEDATEEVSEVPTEQAEAVEDTNEAAPEQGEVIGENNEATTEQNEDLNNTDDTSSEQAGEVESSIDEAPAAQPEEIAAPGEVVTEVPEETSTVQNGNDAEENFVTETKLTTTMVASDGNTYEINVSYHNKSGIPMDTELKVDELIPGDEGYDEYIEESASKVGAKAEDIAFSKVFDIKIVDKNDENTVYEPTGNVDVSIRVIGVSLSDYSQVNVLHFVEDKNDENYLIYDVESTVNEETVEFSTDSFSVYVVIGHEGGEVITPRVKFHFISNSGVTDASTYYIGNPYEFINDHLDKQTTQILKDGESLELIADPTNDGSKYFYGWYVVDSEIVSGITDNYGVGTSNNKLYYTWPENPERIIFESPISVEIDSTDETKANWTLNGVKGSGTLDEDGNVHVFLAPIFENYHFINFMLRPKEETSNNLMTRKLIALGQHATTANVKISDVRSNSTDPVHLVFIGWEYDANAGTGLSADWQLCQTVDYSGAPLNENGVFVSLDFSNRTTVDFYPLFVQARWVDYFAGVSGSGATYVASKFLRSWGKHESPYDLSGFGEGESYFTSLSTSSRTGYDLDGWYAFANTDPKTGKITNLSTPQEVSVNYLDDSLNVHTVKVITEAVRITNGDGSIVNNTGVWGVTDNGDGTGSLTIDGTGNILFEIEDNNGYRLKFYDTLDRLKLCANWLPSGSRITVVYWTENPQEEGYTAPVEVPEPGINATEQEKKEYDDYIKALKAEYTASAVKVINTSDLNTQLGTTFASGSTIGYQDIKNYMDGTVSILAREYLKVPNEGEVGVGAVPNGEEKFYDLFEDTHNDKNLSDTAVEIKGDGSTTLNVFFERKTFKLVFHIGRDGYVKNAGQMKNNSYPDWDGNWIEYMYKDQKVTDLGYTGKGYDSHQGYFSMTYKGVTYDSTYVTWVTNPNTSNAEGNVMGNYVPDPDHVDNDKNLYVIEAKYGAYIGDRWPAPTNPNFTFTDAPGKKKTLYIWTAYWNSLYAYNANNRPHANEQGNNSDINGVHEYMSAELCTNRSGDGLINDKQVHHMVAYFGDSNNANRFKQYHILIEAIDGTYNSVTTVSGTNYTTYTRTTWSQNAGVDSSAIADKAYYELSSSPVISNVEPQYQLGWELDGYELVYSCYDPVQSNNPTITGQKDYHIYFFYRPKQYTLTFNFGNNDTETDTYYYNQTLADADKYTERAKEKVREGYYFAGWYTNAEGVGAPFDFENEKMPNRNVVLYPVSKALMYTVKIDPNGGVIDHNENASQSTYFSAAYGTPVGEYTLEERGFIKLTEKELNSGYTGDKYYYINMQRKDVPSEGDWGLPTELRNAVYVKESEIDTYYNTYADAIDDLDTSYWTDVTKLSKEDFIATYATCWYRPINVGTEHYTFMGWYQVENGSIASMPYNFNDPVTGDLELRALWRLDGGYYIQYNPYYVFEDANSTTWVMGEIEGAWTDPDQNSHELYADQSTTQVLQAPTRVTEGWVFRGWRVVKRGAEKTYTDSENHSYQYYEWEPFGEERYYGPGDSFIVDSALVTDTENGNVIHMQAYYEKIEDTYRKPDVTNLTLDANDEYFGYIDNNTINVTLPPLGGPGHQAINTESELYEGKPTQIEIGDMQSNLAIHLYRYATNKTFNGVTGTKYFTHKDNYLLIGFDEGKNPNYGFEEGTHDDGLRSGSPYVPTYAADSVVAVTRKDNKVLYAIWEPMLYATFVNTTDKPITIKLTGSGADTVSIVNQVTGEFDREQTSTTIVIPAKSGDVNGSVKVVFPKAEDGADITATAVNDHALRKMSVNGEYPSGTAHGTGSTDKIFGENVTYTGTLVTDKDGIVVTYTEVVDAKVYYDVNGGTWTETNPDYQHESGDVYSLDANKIINNNNLYEPSEPTQNGMLFIGWTDNADIAAQHDFSSTSAVTWGTTTITPDADGIVLDKVRSDYLWDFSRPASDLYENGKSLYAVWSEKVTVTFNLVYSQNEPTNSEDWHTWTDDEQATYEPYKFYRSDSGQRPITYTMAKGERVPKPSDPKPTSSQLNWYFIKWLKSNNTTNSYRYSPKEPKDANLTTYAFDFSSRVTADVTLLTSWTANEPQIFTFTVCNEVEGVNTDAEFDYTIAVSNETVLGKMGETKPSKNLIGAPDEKWGSVTTKLKNNQEYTVIVKTMLITDYGGNNSVEITVIDRDGNVVKDGHVFYCNYNTNKNYASDYKFTLSITQDTDLYETTVSPDTDNMTGNIVFAKDDSTPTFTFESSEWRTTNPVQAPVYGTNTQMSIQSVFTPEVNNYQNGNMNNSLKIIFRNTIHPAPTNYSFDYKPFFMMFGFGAILIGLIVPPVVMLRRRKKEEE